MRKKLLEAKENDQKRCEDRIRKRIIHFESDKRKEKLFLLFSPKRDEKSKWTHEDLHMRHVLGSQAKIQS